MSRMYVARMKNPYPDTNIYVYPGRCFQRSRHGKKVGLGSVTVLYHEEFEGLRFVRRGYGIVEFPEEKHPMHRVVVKPNWEKEWYVLKADYDVVKERLMAWQEEYCKLSKSPVGG